MDQHPEYALVVSSDHGGQEYDGQDNFCNHGCFNPSNVGLLMIYTKEIADGKLINFIIVKIIKYI